MKKITIFALLSTLLMSCGKFRDGSSIWQGGLWLIFVLPLCGAAIFFWTAYKASKSGSVIQDQYAPGAKREYDENVPIYKIPQFWFGVALVIAAIVFIIMQNHEK